FGVSYIAFPIAIRAVVCALLPSHLVLSPFPTRRSSDLGFRSIPVVVFFDANWNEIGRWIERSHPATAKAAMIRSKTLDVAEWLRDRKSTRLNSSHGSISYAVFCLKKKIQYSRHILELYR